MFNTNIERNGVDEVIKNNISKNECISYFFACLGGLLQGGGRGLHAEVQGEPGGENFEMQGDEG